VRDYTSGALDGDDPEDVAGLLQDRLGRARERLEETRTASRRIWLSLELAKKPVQCIEYIVVHELAHLIERHHNERFLTIMDQHMPQWRAHREELNSAPLAHETWTY
jgi:predicted metal-dependent hydrolase